MPDDKDRKRVTPARAPRGDVTSLISPLVTRGLRVAGSLGLAGDDELSVVVRQLYRIEFQTVLCDKQHTPFGVVRNRARAFTETLACGTAFEMVEVPRGFMSLEPEVPEYGKHAEASIVTIPRFFMGRTPASHTLWRGLSVEPKIGLSTGEIGAFLRVLGVFARSWIARRGFSQRRQVQTQRRRVCNLLWSRDLRFSWCLLSPATAKMPASSQEHGRQLSRIP